MCGWDQSYTVSVEHSFVCSIFFYIFTKRYRRTKIDFLLLYFFFLLVLEKLNKNFRI